MKEIGTFMNLVSLDLSYTGITDNDLQELRDLQQLQYISLTGNKITNAGLEYLTELKSLETIHISDTDITLSPDELKEVFPNATVNRSFP